MISEGKDILREEIMGGNDLVIRHSKDPVDHTRLYSKLDQLDVISKLGFCG